MTGFPLRALRLFFWFVAHIWIVSRLISNAKWHSWMYDIASPWKLHMLYGAVAVREIVSACVMLCSSAVSQLLWSVNARKKKCGNSHCKACFDSVLVRNAEIPWRFKLVLRIRSYECRSIFITANPVVVVLATEQTGEPIWTRTTTTQWIWTRTNMTLRWSVVITAFCVASRAAAEVNMIAFQMFFLSFFMLTNIHVFIFSNHFTNDWLWLLWFLVDFWRECYFVII